MEGSILLAVASWPDWLSSTQSIASETDWLAILSAGSKIQEHTTCLHSPLEI